MVIICIWILKACFAWTIIAVSFIEIKIIVTNSVVVESRY